MLIKSQKLVNTLIGIGLFIFIVSSVIFIGFRITGFAVLNEINYTDIVNLSLNGSGSYFWGLQKQGDLIFVRISGSIIGNGIVKVYIENNDKKYLVFDNSNTNLITGKVVLSPLDVYNIVNEENLSENLSQSNQSQNLSIVLNESVGNLSSFIENLSNENIVLNESLMNISNESAVNISFLNESLENINNESLINNILNESIINITIFNESMNLTDTSVVQPIYLNNVCTETCNLTGFNSSGYNLIFEIENAVLNLNKINYSLKQPKNITIKEERKQHRAEIGKLVKWVKTVKADQKVDNLIVEIPEGAENITIKKIENKKKLDVENINLVTGYITQDIYNIVSSGKKKEKVGDEIYNLIDTPNETNLSALTTIKNESNLTIAQNETNASVMEDLIASEVNLTIPLVFESEGKNISLLIQEPVEEVEVEYYTEAPQAIENEISNYKKQIIIYSNISYENILSYTYINETVKEGIKLYWIINGSRNLFENVSYVDEDLNGLIERIEWIVPHLSEQTFEIELTILNVQSYPTVGRNWTVMFTTSGNANLSIQAVNGTQWNNENESFDLKFLEVKCDNKSLNYSWVNENVFIFNYSCNEIGYEISKAITSGKHTLRFDFGDLFAYAYNDATSAPDINFTDPTLPNATSTTNTSVEINISITNAADLAEFIWSWNYTNSSFYDNSTVLMFNFDNISAIGENATYAVDVSKYGNNGTISGAVWNASGKYGKALQFDGVNDYVDVGTTSSLDILAPTTIEAWIKSTSSVTYRTIVSKTSNYAGYPIQWQFIIDDATDKLFFYVRHQEGSNDANPSILSDKVVADGNWHHVVVSYSSIDGATKLYIDGILNKSATLTSGNVISSDREPQVGDIYHTSRTNYFNGSIDEVRIWNRSLSAAEIKQHYYSNLYKYATDKWAFYTNQSNLTTGTYTYQGFAADLSGNTNKTDLRFLTIGELVCSVKTSCAGDEINVFQMSNVSDAHASNNNSYDYKVCCKGTGLGTSCTGNYTILLKLSDVVNAHVEQSTYNNYDTSACLSSTTYAFNCTYPTSCTSDFTCVASMSDATDAHVADCTAENSYSTKICCKFIPPIITHKFLNISRMPNTAIYGDIYNFSVIYYNPENMNASYVNLTFQFSNGTKKEFENMSLMFAINSSATNWTARSLIQLNTINESLGMHKYWINASNGTDIIHSSIQTFTVIDAIKPDLKLINPINATSTTSTPIQFNITWTDNILRNTLWWQFNKNGTNIILTNNFTMIFSAGDYIAEFWANDSSNNINYTNASFTVYAPTQPPEEDGGGGVIPPEVPSVIPPVIPPEIPPVIPPEVPVIIPTITIPPAGESLTGARKECLNITGSKKEEADLLAEITGLEFCKEEKIEEIEVKTAYKCNGIEIDVNELVFLQAIIYDKKAKLSLDIGINKTEGRYCPWCYNSKQDYDETGIDCGGSCKSCIREEMPAEIIIFKKEKDFSFFILFLFFIIIGALAIKEEEKIELRKLIAIKPIEAAKIIEKPELVAEARPREFRAVLIEELTDNVNKLNLLINESYNHFNLNKIKQAIDEYYSSLPLYEKIKENLVIDERELIENKLKLLNDRAEISELLNQIRKPIEKYKKEHIAFEEQRVFAREIRKLKESIWNKEFRNHEKVFYNLLSNNMHEEATRFLVKIISFYNQIKSRLSEERRVEFSEKIGLMLMKRRIYKPLEKHEKIEFKFEEEKPEIRQVEVKPYAKSKTEKMMDKVHELIKENKYPEVIKNYSKLFGHKEEIKKFEFEEIEKVKPEERIFEKKIISELEKKFNNYVVGFYRVIRKEGYENAMNLYNEIVNLYNQFDNTQRNEFRNRIEFLELTKEAYKPIKECKSYELKKIKVKAEKSSRELNIETYILKSEELDKIHSLLENNKYKEAIKAYSDFENKYEIGV